MNRSYFSLFDDLSQRHEEDMLFVEQPYTGSFRDMLTELGDILARGAVDEVERAAVVLHPPRVIRATLDYKIDHPTKQSHQYLKDSIDLALAVYRKDKDLSTRLLDFWQTLHQDPSGHELLNSTIHQEQDTATWASTLGTNSEHTALELAVASNEEDILMIALAHGGVAAGLDVFLRYCDMQKSTNSQFYAARFSKYKHSDEFPQLTEREGDYLRNAAYGKQIVIFDEDTATGRTLHDAEVYFRRLFGHNAMIIVANADANEAIDYFLGNHISALEEAMDCVRGPYTFPTELPLMPLATEIVEASKLLEM